MAGVLALVGGGEWRDGCTFDAELLEASGGAEVVVLPTAAAYEAPDKAVAWATRWFEGLGASVRGLEVLERHDALDEEHAEVVRRARFIYLSGGSPLHLRSVLKESPVWDALGAAWHDGAVVAGSSAGAMVLCDPMVDPRGGALTVGLGMVENLAVVPHAPSASFEADHRRTLDLATEGLVLLGIEEQTAALRDPDGTWRTAGAGATTVWTGGAVVGMDALP
jgi:cyanophycinase